MNTHQIYEDVTNTIIELLEEHQTTFDRPWICLGVDNDFARNPTTKNYYRGINQFLLSYKMTKKGYLKNQWATFKQIKSMEGTVRKGEKSTPVIFYKTAYIGKNNKYYNPKVAETMDSGKYASLQIQKIPILKLYRVFNLQSQTENLPEDYYSVEPSEQLQDFEKDDAAEALIKSTGATIIERDGNDAYYNRTEDYIILPRRNQFKGIKENFYSVALHELGHWSGAKKRLDRQFGKFGDTIYAQEELIAELISAFCCVNLGFTKNISNNAAYIKSWLAILKENPKAIFSAAAAAQRGADYILNQQSLKEPCHD